MKMTPGKYLYIVSIVYLIVGMMDLFVRRFIQVDILVMVYVVVLSLPLIIPPLGNWIGLKKR